MPTRMNKLEKLDSITGIGSSNVDGGKTPLCDYESAQKIALKLNEAIDHITALEIETYLLRGRTVLLQAEVDRFKGHTHKSSNHRHDEAQITYGETSTTPPIMETDKQ